MLKGALQSIALAVLAVGVGGVGCIADDDPDLAVDESALLSELPTNVNVYATGNDTALILPPQFSLNAGEAVYINSRGVTTSSDSEVRLQVLGIDCIDATTGVEITDLKSTENRNGTTALRAQLNRILFVAPYTGTFICWLYAAAKDFDGPTPSAWHTYQAGGQTYINSSAIRPAGTAWAWGTDYDTDYSCWDQGNWDASYWDPIAGHCDCDNGWFDQATDLCVGDTALPEGQPGVHIGPNQGAGSTENALRSPRTLVAVPVGYNSLDTRFELEITNCKYGNAACSDPAWGDSSHQNDDAVISAQVVIQQMTTDTGTTVCNDTRGTVQQFNVTDEEVHRKVHLVLDDVPVLTSCGSRTFKMQVVVNWISGNPVKMNYGTNGRRNFSTGFAWAHN